MTKTWEKPHFTELSMNAEIGSYQEDFGSGGNPPILETTTSADAEPQHDEAGE